MIVLGVTFSNLITVAIAAGIAGIGVTAVFSLALLGTARSVERRREGRPAAGWSLLAVVAGVGVLAAAALGVYAVASA